MNSAHLHRSRIWLEPSSECPLRLHVRHVAPATGSVGTIVIVHGATFGSGLWDIAVPGYSTLDALASAGFSVWAPDIRGYAKSERLREPTVAYAGREEAILDIRAVVRFALENDQRKRLMLIGGSWGSVTAGLFATRHHELLHGLALMAPLYGAVNELWLESLADPADRTKMNPALKATREIDLAHVLGRWDPEIPPGREQSRRDEVVLQALMADAMSSEAAGRQSFTVPNGTLVDLFEVFSGRPLYHAKLLELPLLMIRGVHDQTSTAADAQGFFDSVASVDKTYVQMGDSGHFLCAERKARQFQQLLIDFCKAHATSA